MVTLHWDKRSQRFKVRLVLSVEQAKQLVREGQLSPGLEADLYAATELCEERNAELVAPAVRS